MVVITKVYGNPNKPCMWRCNNCKETTTYEDLTWIDYYSQLKWFTYNESFLLPLCPKCKGLMNYIPNRSK